jgi:type III secretion protein O
MSVFVELLRIKEFREKKAETELVRSRLGMAEAAAALELAQMELVRYRDFSDRRERELYSALCERIVRLRDIEDVQWSVGELRGGERSREEQEAAAAKARDQAASVLAQAADTHRVALRTKEKFVELARSFDEERVRELQRLEDMEMEEVRGVAREREEREEWEHAHDE